MAASSFRIDDAGKSLGGGSCAVVAWSWLLDDFSARGDAASCPPVAMACDKASLEAQRQSPLEQTVEQAIPDSVGPCTTGQGGSPVCRWRLS